MIKLVPPMALWCVIAFAATAMGQDAQRRPTVGDITADATRKTRIEQPAAPVRNARPGPIRKIHDVRPVWPAAARSADVRGTVIVEFTIDVDGRVTDARILRGIPLLNAAALDCVRQWRFEPVLLQGRPFPMHMTAAVSFP